MPFECVFVCSTAKFRTRWFWCYTYAQNNKHGKNNRKNLWCVIPMTVMAGLKKTQREDEQRKESVKESSEWSKWFERESHLYILYMHACVMLCFAPSLSLLLLCVCVWLCWAWIHFVSHPWPVRPNSNCYRRAWNNKTTTTTSLSVFPG